MNHVIMLSVPGLRQADLAHMPRLSQLAAGGETAAAQRVSAAARANTASSIGSVSRPVNVFCWLGW